MMSASSTGRESREGRGSAGDPDATTIKDVSVRSPSCRRMIENTMENTVSLCLDIMAS